MKVLHINSYYSGSSFYRNLYDKQVENGLDIDVFVPVSSSLDSSNLKLGNYTIVSQNHGKYDRILFHLKHNKIYKDIVRKYQIKYYSIIHAHSLFSNGYIAMKLKQGFGIPYVVAVRNTDVNYFFKYMIHLRKLGVKILKEAEKVIFLSKPYKKMLIEKYLPFNLKKEIIDKSEIIPNGIDDFWFENRGLPIEYHGNKNLKILHVGVVNKNKNLTTTIRSIELLKEKGYDVKFTVVGRIEDKSIYNQIKNISYLNYITPKPKEELKKIYQSNDIFVLPSKTETFGLVYAEAMSQGLPVIYTKGQGFDGQFNEGEVGYSAESNSAEEIAERIEDILAHYEAISKNCVRKVDRFNWGKVTKAYIQLYSQMIN